MIYLDYLGRIVPTDKGPLGVWYFIGWLYFNLLLIVLLSLIEVVVIIIIAS